MLYFSIILTVLYFYKGELLRENINFSFTGIAISETFFCSGKKTKEKKKKSVD